MPDLSLTTGVGQHCIGPVSIDPVGRHYIDPVGHEAGVLALTDLRGGHFFENWPTETLSAGRQAR